MLVLLTGKTNTGKSSIIKKLREQNIQCFVADEYVSEIYKRDAIGYNQILEKFGPEYVGENTVNKKKLGELILSNNDAFDKLCKTIWPLIRDKIIQIKNSDENTVVELAIYRVDYLNIFKDLFDIKINLNNGFLISNIKSKYETFYNDLKDETYDFEITNIDLEKCFKEIIEILTNKNFI
ncbi:MAG: dephospho-CoA kinase [Mycoplasma sp.]